MSLYTDQLNKVKINGKELAACQYKGISFFKETASFSDGRRIVTDEYPNSDDPSYQDINRLPRVYEITGYFLDFGNLLSALDQYDDAVKTWNETPGAGTLIVPEIRSVLKARSGIMPATIGKQSAIIRFSITFYIETQEVQKLNPIFYKKQIIDQNTSILASLKAGMEEFFDVINKPQSVYNSAIDATRDTLDLIETAKDGLRKTAGYVDKLNQLKQNVGLIVLNAGSLADQLIDLLTYIPETLTSASTLLNDGLNLSATEKNNVSTGTIPTDISLQEQINNEQLNQVTTVAGLTQIAQYSTDIELTSTDDTTALIETIKDSFYNLMQDTTNFALYDQVQRLLTLTVDSLELRLKELPSIRTFEVNGTTTALNLSQDIFADYESAEDIIERNNIQHPMFVPSNSTIEVLV